jgi:flagellar basal body-associated protein FliL
VRLAAALMLLMCLFAGLASASSSSHAPKKPEAEREKGSGFAGPRIPTISMPALVTPVVVNGALEHYVFLSLTLELTGDEHKNMMLEKIPYLQDAYLREVHRASVAKDNDPKVIDEEGLKVRLMRVSATVVGPDIVKAITLRNVVQGAQ